jgi:hypothetical protein
LFQSYDDAFSQRKEEKGEMRKKLVKRQSQKDVEEVVLQQPSDWIG